MVSDIKRDIPKFNTVLPHSTWGSLRRKYLNSNTHKRIVLWAKNIKISRISDTISPRYIRKNSRSMYARVAQFFSKNSKIVAHHKDNPNSRNDARLRSPSLITATGLTSLIAENWTKFGLKAGI